MKRKLRKSTAMHAVDSYYELRSCSCGNCSCVCVLNCSSSSTHEAQLKDFSSYNVSILTGYVSGTTR